MAATFDVPAIRRAGIVCGVEQRSKNNENMASKVAEGQLFESLSHATHSPESLTLPPICPPP